MSFIVKVETAHTSQGAVTNSHSKQATKRPNKLLHGRRVCIAKIKKQTDNQDYTPLKINSFNPNV
jgi:hypothetical protein